MILERYSNLAVLPEESRPEEPLKPLDPECIEMAILAYEQEKQSWLAAHSNIQAKDYRKIRGFGKFGNVVRGLEYNCDYNATRTVVNLRSGFRCWGRWGSLM